MEVIIFLVVIVVLIVVHELGHFVVAKLAGIRVDEFGLGYPPRALTLGKIGETEYTLNWLPFGGFVKIYGEDGNAEGSRAFASKNRAVQALVLVAGIVMNILFAFVLLTIVLMGNTPRAIDPSQASYAKDIQLAVADVLPGSPASTAGIEAGDTVASASDRVGTWNTSEAANAQTFTDFVEASGGAPISLTIDRNGKVLPFTVTPEEDVVPGDSSRYALGLSIAPIGVVPLSFGQAIIQGAELTWDATRETAQGLGTFFLSIFTLSANLSQVSGPVGIAGAVGTAAQAGFGALLSLAALISINLALINLIPIPALDGGRLLFVLIESITRRPIRPIIANTLNSVGFALLILLMVVVTFHDIYKIVG